MTEKKKTETKTAKAKKAAPKTEPVAEAAPVEAARPELPSPKKDSKPKNERPPRESREGWGTFALKLPVAEREAFHAASGTAGASRFARIVLNAFSNEDEAAFKAAVVEARKLR